MKIFNYLKIQFIKYSYYVSMMVGFVASIFLILFGLKDIEYYRSKINAITEEIDKTSVNDLTDEEIISFLKEGNSVFWNFIAS